MPPSSRSGTNAEQNWPTASTASTRGSRCIWRRPSTTSANSSEPRTPTSNPGASRARLARRATPGGGVIKSELNTQVEELRAHISETCRLHPTSHPKPSRDGAGGRPGCRVSQLRGSRRRTSSVLDLDSPAHDAAASTVLNWYYKAVDGYPEPTAEQAMELSATIKVLVTRSGVSVDDLADALRWRVRSEKAAAEQAGLPEHEWRAHHRSGHGIRSGTALRPRSGPPMRTGQTLGLASLTSALVPALRKHQRSVVFCGPEQLTPLLVQYLRALMGGEHERMQSCRSGANRGQVAVSWSWTGQARTASTCR